MSFSIYLGENLSIKFVSSSDLVNIQIEGLLRQNIGRFNTMAHHAKAGTDPGILDIGQGCLSILDISDETLSKTPNHGPQTVRNMSSESFSGGRTSALHPSRVERSIDLPVWKAEMTPKPFGTYVS